jgi:hypothetical protein
MVYSVNMRYYAAREEGLFEGIEFLRERKGV